MMTRRATLVTLALSSLALLVLPFLETAATNWVLVLCAACFPPALILFAVEAGRRRRLAGAVGALFVCLAGSFLGMLALRGTVDTLPWLGGIPAGLAILLGGLWILPSAIAVLAYIFTFEGPPATDDGPDEIEA